MNHLSKETAKIALMSDTERMNRILAYKWIGYTRAREIQATMDYLMLHPKIHRMPNLLLVSRSGNGKTQLLQRFFDAHKPEITSTGDHRIIPVIYVQAPPRPEEKAFYVNILEALNAPYNVRNNVYVLRQQSISILKNVETKILILDEIHHVLAGSHLSQRAFLNEIKYLANELQIVIIAAGIKDALVAINTDNQLANRFEPAILPKWTMDEEYLRLLSSFEAILPLREPSDLATEELAMKILSLSGGTIGEISAVLKKAALEAIKTRKERIDLSLLGRGNFIAPSNRQKQYEHLI
jgi:hypothetical protein